MDKREQALTKPILLVTGLIILLALSVYFYEPILLIFGHIGVSSASESLPSAGVDFSHINEVVQEVMASGQSESETIDETTTDISTTIAETTTQAATETVSHDNEFYIYKTVSSITELTQTPDDILELIAQAEETADSDMMDGEIYEKQYTTEGATDSYDYIYVKNTNETQIDIEDLLSQDADIAVNKDEPMVLIIHSHTTESYQILDRDFYAVDYLSKTDDLSLNVYRVGEAIAAELEEAGYIVIHDSTIHDYSYSKSYSNSAAAVEAYLEQYPSIQIVIDIHRDAIQTTDGVKYKPTAVIEGKKAAQVMIISGCQEDANGITDFDDWEYNLLFALDLQDTLETMFSGITRPLYFTAKKYVMNYTRNSVLIEVGSDANTLEEAVYSGKLVGIALSSLLDIYMESE